MVTRALRRSLQRQEGQALVLACVLMLILSIALMTTVNIGHSVHERIRLQNTADAAAYSTAAMEARAFNFYAFTNRTQVSHYVSAMIWQSTDSFLFSVQAFLTDIYGLIRTIGPCFPKDSRSGIFWPVICAVLDNLPYVGAVMAALDAVVNVLKNLLLVIKPILDAADQIIGTVIIPLHRLLNASMAGAATAVMLTTSTYVFGTSNAIVEANDPNITPGVSQAITGALNQCLYGRAHYREANGQPTRPANPLNALDPTRRDENDKVARAKRVMAGITNATRYACNKEGGFNTCPETLVTDRRLGQLLPIPPGLSVLESLLDSIPKWGQTRLLTYQLGRGGHQEATRGNNAKKQNKIRESRDLPGSPMGMIAQGDVLGSDDPYYIKLGPASLGVPSVGEIYNPFSCPKYYERRGDERSWRDCWGDPREDRDSTLETSIWAMSRSDFRRNGIHWRVVFPGEAKSMSDRQAGLYESKPCLARLATVCLFDELSVFAANTHIDPRDNNHPWEGLVPFPHFEPGDYASDCATGAFQSASDDKAATREHEFNQPSTWVMLNKNTQQLQNGNTQDATGATRNSPALLNSTGKFSFALGSRGTQTLDLDNDRKKFLSFSEGMNVISRGQTYYHRPGNWAEQPNFFNPYWRPRLAAVWQGKDSLPLIRQLSNALPAAVKDAPAKIITH